MLPSMFAGISGLNAHQKRMTVVGNDIANVNTIGYKQSDATFKESLINTLRAPAVGTPGLQVGLGVNMSGITKDFSSGMLMETGQSSHMGIQGEGFFVVQDPSSGSTFYTRAGDFALDAVDANTVNLITSDGYTVIGTDGLPINLEPGGATLSSFSVGQDGTITVVDTAGATTTPNTVRYVAFQNNNGLSSEGGGLYSWTAAASAAAPTLAAANTGVGSILQGYLENSNVDLAKEFVDMIISQRGFQANAKSITTADEMLMELLSLKR